MKQKNAMHTVVNAMHNARRALKPAIMDLCATDDDYMLEKTMRLYLSAVSQERRAAKLISYAGEVELAQ